MYYEEKDTEKPKQRRKEEPTEDDRRDVKEFKCEDCRFRTDKKKDLMNHIVSTHEQIKNGINQNPNNYNQRRNNNVEDRQQRNRNKEDREQRRSRNGDREQFERNNSRRPKCYSREERRSNGCCVHWNKGYCSYEEFCRFLHEESPMCNFQQNCRRKETCRYFHSSQSFLGQRWKPNQNK